MVCSPGTFVSSANILGSWRGDGTRQVSGRNTIFASSPLAAWTVITRTASSAPSMSRLIEYSSPARSLRKAASEGALLLFMGDGETQEFVDRIAGFRSKSRFDVAASAIRAEKTRIESKRTAAGPRAPASELVYGPGMLCVRGSLERIEKTCCPARRERHEIVIVEPDERRFQHAGEHEIVLRKQASAASRDEVHDGDMLRELKPVGASRADFALFQGPDHRLEKRPACANEDQNVARAHRPPPQCSAVVHKFIGTRIDELRDLLGNPLGNKIGRVFRIEKIERKRPRAGILTGLRRRQRPEFDKTRQLMLQRLVRHPNVIRRDKPAFVIPVLENLVDRGKNAGRRAKRQGERHLRERLSAGRKLGFEFSPHLVEHVRRGALEGKDRLLFVADREESARAWALPAPGREIAGELFENFPLGFARVLRLIDQNMVDSRIELIEHPACIRAFEQSQGLFDEIIEIEDSARRFLLAIALEDGTRDLDQRARAIECRGGLALGAKPIEAELLGVKFGSDFRMLPRKLIGAKDRGRAAFAVVGKKMAR